jgi:hypothetical protein
MTWYDILGWAATVAVLAAYASHRPQLFDGANALLWVPVALPAFLRGAYNSVAISATFGIIGTIAVLRRHRSRETAA